MVALPPLNVYRHLSAMSPELAVTESQIYDYALMCVKPVYGRNDAPLAWQLCFHSFIKTTGGEHSHLDENTFSWKENQRLVAMATTHVDHIALTASSKWMDEMYKGKVTRQQLPFTHCGCEYEKVENGYKIHQQDFAKKLKPARVPQRGDEEKLDKDEITELRAILGGLLWLTATRLDINADLSLLQSRVAIAQIKNQVLDKVHAFQDIGLFYCYMETGQQRLMCIHDASSASTGRHYAQEGVLVGLADDYFHGETFDLETVFEDSGPRGVQLHGVLHASGGKQ